jgi:hypothetical protein
VLCVNTTARRRRLRAGAAAHSLSFASVASATVAMRHLNRNGTGQMARNTIVVAVNLIIPPALRPPSARVVVVVAQTRDILGIIRMIGQDQRDIAVRTLPRARQGHRVMHRDGVDSHTLDSLDSTRIPHCPLFSDIMQGACQAQCYSMLYVYLFFSIFPFSKSAVYLPYTRGYCTRAQSRRFV